MDAALATKIRLLDTRLANLERILNELNRGATFEDELEKIPGRRIFHTLVGSQTFTTSQDGQRTTPITFEVSQDGPFIMTHYPVCGWRSSAPSTATDFGRWRPVTTWPLPDQVIDTNIIDISYEMSDSGSGRNMQNDIPVPGLLISHPGNLQLLPKPTYFRPNTVITFTPTYNDITFAGSTPTTEGTLVISLPGYKIVNLG